MKNKESRGKERKHDQDQAISKTDPEGNIVALPQGSNILLIIWRVCMGEFFSSKVISRKDNKLI